ncbi:hypothetical protein KR093_009258, partial [Drosophila rubida]
FDKLNDDCLLKILEYVKDLRDQMALRRVCKSLYHNVNYHWEHITEICLDGPELDYFEEYPDDLHALLKHACESVESIVMSRGCAALLPSWLCYEFPNVVSLDCELFHTSNDPDEDTKMLTKLFPDITHLSLQSSATGKYIWRWKYLTSLHFYCCESLDPVMLERVFAQLRLRKLTMLFYGYSANLGDGLMGASQIETLQELVIDDHHLLGDFMPNLMKLRNFRKLSFYTRDYYEHLVQSVSKLQPLRVCALSFFDAFWSSETLCNSIDRMRNMRRLVLQDDDIESSQLHTICSRLKCLEELHLISMRSLPTVHQIWGVVEATYSLNLLNLTSCTLDPEFLKQSASRLPKVLKKRGKRILTLNLCDTFVEADK